MPPARSSPSRASSPSSPDLPEDQPASGYRPRMTDQGNDPTRPIPVTGDDPTRAMPPVPPTPPGPPPEPPLVVSGGEPPDRRPWIIAGLLGLVALIPIILLLVGNDDRDDDAEAADRKTFVAGKGV